ncbi:HTH-type transcriptional repressor CarH [Phycicoccus ginsengisoli]
MHTIGTTAALTGVPVATLRAWERRYAVVAPARTESGYRLYDDRAVRLLTAMAALVAAGWSPRDAAAHVAESHPDATPEEPEPAGAPGAGGPATGSGLDLGALSRAAGRLDPRLAEAALDQAFALTGPEQAVDGWLLPALRVLGRDWRAGRVDVAGEHLVSNVVQRRLGAALDAAGPEPSHGQVLVGLPRGVRHELGVLAFAVLLRRAGTAVAYLGADVPPASWAAAVRAHLPAAVVLGVPSPTDVVATREAVAVLRTSASPPRVYVGGSAQHQVGQGTTVLGHHLGTAVERLVQDLRKRHPATGA